jgi:hypothetical protein
MGARKTKHSRKRSGRLPARWKQEEWILHEVRKRKANWIGHILRRNCLLKQVIEGKIKGRIEVTRRRGRRRKMLLDDLGDRRGYSHLKEEGLDRIKWRNRFGRGCGPVVWQITDDGDEATCSEVAHAQITTVGLAISTAATWIHCLQRPLLLINWLSWTWLRWNDKPAKSVTLRNPSFCQGTFPAPSDVLGDSLCSVVRVP